MARTRSDDSYRMDGDREYDLAASGISTGPTQKEAEASAKKFREKTNRAQREYTESLDPRRDRGTPVPLKPKLALPVLNASGILPTEFKVVVLPVEIDAKIGSIIVPVETRDHKQYAQQEGILIAVSPAAFTYFEADVRDQAPKPGDRILYAKYAGFTRKGNDGVDYKVINDRDVAAVLV